MPQYLYHNLETGETVELNQSINDKHEFVDGSGKKWDRVFTVPNAAVHFNPNSKQSFVDATNNAGTVGDLYSMSADLSEKRAKQNGGIDPVKVKFFDNYSKERGGRKHPMDARKQRKPTVMKRK